MLKKILGASTLFLAGALIATSMLEGGQSLTVNASGLNRDVEQQLETTYGDNWDEQLVKEYGKNWREELEAKYNTSINKSVMMEVALLNQDDEDFWQQCLTYMYGDNWEAQLQTKYGNDYQDYITSEVATFLSASGDLDENQNDNEDNGLNQMPGYNQNGNRDYSFNGMHGYRQNGNRDYSSNHMTRYNQYDSCHY